MLDGEQLETPQPQGFNSSLNPVWANLPTLTKNLISKLSSWLDAGFVLLVLGGVLRVWMWAQGHSFWLDEQLVALNIRHYDLLGLAGRQDNGTGAPLGWLWLERILLTVFGQGERGLKLPSMLFSIATLAVAWWLGRRWLGPIASAVLVGLFAVNPIVVTYTDQLKHYSADVLFVLLLLGLAGLVIEQPRRRRRIIAFWTVGAVALWLCMGALLVMPGLALVVAVSTLMRQGIRHTVVHLLCGLGYLFSLLGHYLLSLRYTVGSDYLQAHWTTNGGYPAPTLGPWGLAKWYLHHLAQLSDHPLRVPQQFGVPVGFWLLVVAGIALTARRDIAYGALLLIPGISAALFAYLHLVPLLVRLALWIVPSLFLATAIAVQGVVAGLRAIRRPRLALTAAAAAAIIGAALIYSWKPVIGETIDLALGTPLLDDRHAIAWLTEQHTPGDLTIFVSSATTARLWYDPTPRLTPAKMALTTPAHPDCDRQTLATATRGYRRVLAYSGVRYIPYLDSYHILHDQLAQIGNIVHTEQFGQLGIVYVVELNDQPGPASTEGCLILYDIQDNT